jgi:ADP-ribose pyrophosphatase YjhB (NUDIX family)
MKEAAGVLIKSHNKILGFNRADNTGWSIPFGKADPDEAPNETAIRECLEETGFKVIILDHKPFIDFVGQLLCYTFLAEIVGGTQLEYKENEGYCEFIDPKLLLTGGYVEYNENMLKHFSVENSMNTPYKPFNKLRKFAKTFKSKSICNHNWVSAKNQIVQNGSVCTLCCSINPEEPEILKKKEYKC